MVDNYDSTPSFYNNEEVFKKFLGCTSYYSNLQGAVSRIISFIKPNKVVEFGSATGATSVMLADCFPESCFIGIDMRPDIVKVANDIKDKKCLKNISFKVGDMTNLCEEIPQSDFIFMLYAFHHIPDPLQEKVNFLDGLYKSMKEESYLCIAETFLPESAEGIYDIEAIRALWEYRNNEGYSSTFWSVLKGLKHGDISNAIEIADFCCNYESKAGELVAKRQDEFLVKASWLEEEAGHAGFSLVLNKPVNSIGERVLLFRKGKF